MKSFILKKVCLTTLLVSCVAVNAATSVKVSFSGSTTEGRYCLLDSVLIENLTMNWKQVLDCEQDTTCEINVSNIPAGIDNVYSSEACGGLISNCYNHIYGETSFTLNPRNDGVVHIRIIDVAGRITLEHIEYLCAGHHQYSLHLSSAQTYVLHVVTEDETAATKVINLANTGENSLFRVTSLPSLESKRITNTESLDLMRYTGYTNQKGVAVASEPILQYQSGDEHIMLNFAPVAKSQEGMYVGMTGFNSQLFEYSFDILTQSNIETHQQFVTNLKMASGTILYHAVYTALEKVVKAPVLQKIENVSLVTFTDGLDIGSWRMNSNYPSESLYLAAVNRQIHRTYIDGVKLDAYAIGVKGSDVTDVTRFENDLHQLANDSANVYSVTNMEEVNAHFREIAAKIYNTKVAYSLTIKLPAPDPGSIIRFTFDNISNANNSNYYIEGTYDYDFNNRVGILKNITYSGIRCSNGTTWISTPSGIFDLFTINNLTNSLGEKVSTSHMQQWTYIPSSQSWQVNSEFNPSSNSTTSENHSSALVMLVLDCSSSLSSDFSKMQTAAKSFLNILAGKGDLSCPTVSKATYTLGDLEATLKATITNSGNLTIIDKGFCVSENPNMDGAQFYRVGSGTENFNYVINNLIAGKKYYCCPYAVNSWGKTFGTITSFTAIAYTIPTVSTSSATNITSSSAKCGGNITNNGNTTITERGLCWSLSSTPTIEDNRVQLGSGTGSFSGTISGLTDGVTHYVRAYAINSKGTGYGDVRSFTTKTIVQPTVTTSTISNITINSAKCSGEVTSAGNSTIIERGLCWSKSPNPTIEDSILVIGAGTGTFNGTMQYLEDGTTYYVRAYAKNSKCVGYGEEVSFTTIAIVPPTVITNEISAITTCSAFCGGNVSNDGNMPVIERGLCWSKSPNPTIKDSFLVIGAGTGTFNGTMQNLEDGTTYYVRAYAKNSKCIGYGEEVSFTTIEIEPPIVTLLSTSVKAQDIVSCSGQISFDGNSPIVERGFCWSILPNPTIEDNHIVVDVNEDVFNDSIIHFDIATKYYIRAYVKNKKYVSYSQEIKDFYVSVILYEANEKLPEVKDKSLSGVYTNGFNLPIMDHTFKDGKGSIVFNGEITNIGDSAFSKCANLSSISIPNSVTRIGNAAFWLCTGLTSIEIPNSVKGIEDYAFYACKGLTSVKLSNNITSIGDWAFDSCSGLTSIEIPNSISSIGNSTFSNCTGLTSVEIPNSVTSIGDGTFSGCSGLTSVEIPNSVTNIGNYAFVSCTGLTSVEIPNSVTRIGNSAFRLCTGLTSVEIPNSVTSIGDGTFSGCSGLTSVEIPNSVTSIGDGTFSGCSSLTSVEIPNGVTSIGSSAFGGCSRLTLFEIPNSVTSIGDAAFCGCKGWTSLEISNNVTSIGKRAFEGWKNLKIVTIGENVTDIGGETFSYCDSIHTIIWKAKNSKSNMYVPAKSLTSFIFGDEVETIPYMCCYNMTKLSSINIPNSVVSIGEAAFSGCSGLTSITIGNSVASIGTLAFYNCSNLVKLIVNRYTPPSLGVDPFYQASISTCKLEVPATSISAYKSATGWKSFVNIQAISE